MFGEGPYLNGENPWRWQDSRVPRKTAGGPGAEPTPLTFVFYVRAEALVCQDLGP